MVDFIACSGYLRLSAYTWGIFLAYMCRRLSSRLRFSVFWEVERDKVRSWQYVNGKLNKYITVMWRWFASRRDHLKWRWIYNT